eukprot:GHVS01057261.1.p1 GENE.GHVS01057261.1~~GHVS01057261.1.p1  ORF type:complete len:1199 (-),score=246.33 GHVS01057261.1:250-3813(-)
MFPSRIASFGSCHNNTAEGGSGVCVGKVIDNFYHQVVLRKLSQSIYSDDCEALVGEWLRLVKHIDNHFDVHPDDVKRLLTYMARSCHCLSEEKLRQESCKAHALTEQLQAATNKNKHLESALREERSSNESAALSSKSREEELKLQLRLKEQAETTTAELRNRETAKMKHVWAEERQKLTSVLEDTEAQLRTLKKDSRPDTPEATTASPLQRSHSASSSRHRRRRIFGVPCGGGSRGSASSVGEGGVDRKPSEEGEMQGRDQSVMQMDELKDAIRSAVSLGVQSDKEMTEFRASHEQDLLLLQHQFDAQLRDVSEAHNSQYTALKVDCEKRLAEIQGQRKNLQDEVAALLNQLSLKDRCTDEIEMKLQAATKEISVLSDHSDQLLQHSRTLASLLESVVSAGGADGMSDSQVQHIRDTHALAPLLCRQTTTGTFAISSPPHLPVGVDLSPTSAHRVRSTASTPGRSPRSSKPNGTEAGEGASGGTPTRADVASCMSEASEGEERMRRSWRVPSGANHSPTVIAAAFKQHNNSGAGEDETSANTQSPRQASDINGHQRESRNGGRQASFHFRQGRGDGDGGCDSTLEWLNERTDSVGTSDYMDMSVAIGPAAPKTNSESQISVPVVCATTKARAADDDKGSGGRGRRRSGKDSAISSCSSSCLISNSSSKKRSCAIRESSLFPSADVTDPFVEDGRGEQGDRRGSQSERVGGLLSDDESLKTATKAVLTQRSRSSLTDAFSTIRSVHTLSSVKHPLSNGCAGSAANQSTKSQQFSVRPSPTPSAIGSSSLSPSRRSSRKSSGFASPPVSPAAASGSPGEMARAAALVASIRSSSERSWNSRGSVGQRAADVGKSEKLKEEEVCGKKVERCEAYRGVADGVAHSSCHHQDSSGWSSWSSEAATPRDATAAVPSPPQRLREEKNRRGRKHDNHGRGEATESKREDGIVFGGGSGFVGLSERRRAPAKEEKNIPGAQPPFRNLRSVGEIPVESQQRRQLGGSQRPLQPQSGISPTAADGLSTHRGQMPLQPAVLGSLRLRNKVAPPTPTNRGPADISGSHSSSSSAAGLSASSSRRGVAQGFGVGGRGEDYFPPVPDTAPLKRSNSACTVSTAIGTAAEQMSCCASVEEPWIQTGTADETFGYANFREEESACSRNLQFARWGEPRGREGNEGCRGMLSPPPEPISRRKRQ